MCEWISLAELAGKPVAKYMIQIIRKRVRRSITKEIEVQQGRCSIPINLYWCPIIFGVRVVSKTPAQLRVVGIRYVAYHEGNPIQYGCWEMNLPASSSGYAMSIVIIKGKGNADIEVGVNPVMLGRWPSNNANWDLVGVLDIDCAYGTLNVPFALRSIIIENEQRWRERGCEFKQRFESV